MNQERFLRLIETYGADESHWPEGERAAARVYLHDTPAVTAALTEARELDAFMNSVQRYEASSDLRSAILATAPGSISTQPATAQKATALNVAINALISTIRRQLAPIGAAAGATAAGLMVGIFAAGAVESGAPLTPEDEFTYFASQSSVFRWIEESEDSDA